LKLAWA